MEGYDIYNLTGTKYVALMDAMEENNAQYRQGVRAVIDDDRFELYWYGQMGRFAGVRPLGPGGDAGVDKGVWRVNKSDTRLWVPRRNTRAGKQLATRIEEVRPQPYNNSKVAEALFISGYDIVHDTDRHLRGVMRSPCVTRHFDLEKDTDFTFLLVPKKLENYTLQPDVVGLGITRSEYYGILGE